MQVRALHRLGHGKRQHPCTICVNRYRRRRASFGWRPHCLRSQHQ